MNCHISLTENQNHEFCEGNGPICAVGNLAEMCHSEHDFDAASSVSDNAADRVKCDSCAKIVYTYDVEPSSICSVQLAEMAMALGYKAEFRPKADILEDIRNSEYWSSD